jgi:hypothetical protein
MRRNNHLILIFLFSGLILIGIAFLISKWIEGGPKIPPIATVEKISDQVFVLRKQLTQREVVGKRSLVYNLETVETGVDGEAVLDFTSSHRIKVYPSSEVTLGKEGDKTVIYLKSGDVKVEAQGREGGLFISKDGTRWNANEYEPSKKEGDAGFRAQERTMAEGLNPSYILMTLSAQKGTFYKCYTLLLQKNPKLTGEASISLTIEPTGKISRSEITTSTISDSTFKKCILEATNRIEFKPFSGEPITTVFPLKFE